MEHAPKSDKYTGFLERVAENDYDEDYDNDADDDDSEEHQFDQEPPNKNNKKRVKLETSPSDESSNCQDEDPTVISLLKTNSHYKSSLPVDAVWQVNIHMFHQSLRA